ncbi:hypothetical protein GTA08_BOTSDO05300 [Neofusicoccum parvum]|nr:hypothetical protein GTA08_BOTSDO05300 [Neofusicoccum parvum]
MRVTKLLSSMSAVLLGFLLVGIVFAIPFDKSDGTLGHGLSSHLDSPGAVNNALLALAQPPAQDCGDLGNTQPLKKVRGLSDDSDPLSGWAGAKYDSSPSGHFTAIQGTFTVPKPVIPAGAPIDGSISNWTTIIAVWIGGEDPLLSTGVQLFAHLSGEVSFEAWFQGGLNAASDYKDMTISEGDSVTLRIEMYSHTSGITIIDNITTGKRASQPLATLSNPLPPPSEAAWIVAVPYDTDHSAPFASFGTVKFTDAVVFTSDARNFGPGDGAIAENIYYDNPYSGNGTVTDIGNREVTISYIPRQVETRDSDNLDTPLGSLPTSISAPASIVNVTSGALNDNIYKSTNWAGAMIEEPPAHSFFTSVSGTFTIPGLAVPVNVAHADTYYVAIWVGIDGSHQGDALFQAGIQVTIDSATGVQSVVPWAEWLPAGPQYYNDLAVSVGDVITVHIETTSPTTGTVFIENKTTGQSIGKAVNAPDGAAVTGHSAEWIVEDPVGNGGPHPFGDFGHVVFTDCEAVSDDGNPFGPDGAAKIEFYKGASPEPLTNVETSETGLAITYKPPPPPAAAIPLAPRDTATNDSHYSTNWAGAWINPPASHFTSISGTFTIPRLTPGASSSPTTPHTAAIWLGLDGLAGTPSLLQAGIALTLPPTPGAPTLAHAWTEWLPRGAQPFPTSALALTPGDVIALNITAASPLAAAIVIENLSTGQRVERAVAAPGPDAALRGSTAEWIVERAPVAAVLADFAEVVFEDCGAGLAGGGVVGLGDAAVQRDVMVGEAEEVVYTDVVVDAARGVVVVAYNPRRVQGLLEEVATVVVDEDGEPILVDADGVPVLDADGRPIVVGGPHGGVERRE